MTETAMTKKEEFLAMVRRRFIEEYPWAKDEKRLDRMMQGLINLIEAKPSKDMTIEERVLLEQSPSLDLMAVGEKTSPIVYECWRTIGMRKKLNDINLRELNE